MRQGSHSKRHRGRSNGRRSNGLASSYESNGPNVKFKGSAAHLQERYEGLAQDAVVAGDRVAAEGYMQHAEHYQRIINAHLAAQAEANDARQRAGNEPREADGQKREGRSEGEADGQKREGRSEGEAAAPTQEGDGQPAIEATAAAAAPAAEGKGRGGRRRGRGRDRAETSAPRSSDEQPEPPESATA